jgi:ATP-dependent DNA ligase
MTIYEILTTLESDNSRNFKLDVLRKHQDNELLKQVINLALNPFVQFYQRKIPDYVTVSDGHLDLEQVFPGLSLLSSRTITGNAAITRLSGILATLTPDDAKVVERIIQKDLKCGVSTKTVNDVWPGLIPEYPCMLCSGYDDKLVSKIKFPAIIQKKEDGMRFNAIVKGGKVEFRSRNGKQIDLLGNLEKEFLAMAGDMDIVYDGELIVKQNDQILDRQTGNGILNKATKGTISKQEAELVHAMVWDRIPYTFFTVGLYNAGYEERFILLCYELNKLKIASSKSDTLNSYRINTIATDQVESLEEAKAIFNEYLLQGYEGIVIKDKSSFWENKRSKSQIKMKAGYAGDEAVKDCDLLCVGVQTGTGKYSDMIGSLQCQSSDGIVTVSVGSGFTDEDRKLLPEEYLDKIITVKYTSKIINKQGKESLFLPVFVEIRNDKDTANSSEEI